MISQNRPARIIFVEDNPAHIFLAKTALEAENIANKIEFFQTAEEAIAYMNVNPYPDLIFIDMNLQTGQMQGEELARLMLRDEKYQLTEINLMSVVYLEREKENELAETRIKRFLKKPLITDQLEEVVKHSKRLKKLIVVSDEIHSVAA